MAGYLLEQEGVIEGEGAGLKYVQAACLDLETATLPARDRILFRYLRKTNDTPAACCQADVDAVRAAGWSDHAIYDGVTVCAIFNFFNRWIDGTGVPDVPAGFYEARLATSGDVGYAM